MKIVKEGLWVIIPSVFVPILLIVLTKIAYWGLIFILTAIFIFFFRDPNRLAPTDPRAVVAPADGRIILIDDKPNELSFFIELSVVNCHLQRAPLGGTVTKVVKFAGRHRRFHLFSPKFGLARKKIRAATENARNQIEVQLDNSPRKMWITQIVGAFARRLKSFVTVGQVLQKGEKVGLIYFGSMVKLQLEGEYELKVTKNQKVKAGETIIAYQRD
jgi:phosphatidylserine decarboxylase